MCGVTLACFWTAHVELQYRVSLTKRQTATGTTRSGNSAIDLQDAHEVRGLSTGTGTRRYTCSRSIRSGMRVLACWQFSITCACNIVSFPEPERTHVCVFWVWERDYGRIIYFTRQSQVCFMMSVILWDLMGYHSTTFCKGESQLLPREIFVRSCGISWGAYPPDLV